MNDEDVKKLAAEIIKQTEEKHNSFRIDPQKHYDQHQRIDRILRVYETAQSATVRTIIGLLVLGGLFVAAVGAGLINLK
jgi:hypothetical protein